MLREASMKHPSPSTPQLHLVKKHAIPGQYYPFVSSTRASGCSQQWSFPFCIHPSGIFMGFCDFFLIRACIVLAICIFPLQISEMVLSKRSMHESSLSPTTLALQMVAFILLGLSSKRNLGQPGDPWNITPPGHIIFETRYRMGAWQWMNNMIFGFGQGLLLLIYLWVKILQWTSRGRIQNMDETTALL